MKKLFIMVAAVFVVCAFAACGSPADESPNNDQVLEETPSEGVDNSNPAGDADAKTGDSLVGSKLSIHEADSFFENYYDIASELATIEISTTIDSQKGTATSLESDNLRDFKFQCGNSIFHFLISDSGEPAENVQFVQGVIHADDAAPYYLAAFLSQHKGIAKEQALTEATELIMNSSAENGGSIRDEVYTTSIIKVDDFYYLLSGYIDDFNEDSYYSERIDVNSADLIAHIMGTSGMAEPLEPIVYTGTGDSVVEVDSIEKGYVFHISGNQDGRHFAVKAYDSDAGYLALLANTTDPYDGITLDPTLTTTTLEITASGAWTIELVPMSTLPTISSGQTITGSGDSVVRVDSFGTTAIITGNASERHFAVKSYGDTRDNLMVNTTDAYDGTVMLKGDPFLLEITAKGEWTITF